MIMNEREKLVEELNKVMPITSSEIIEFILADRKRNEVNPPSKLVEKFVTHIQSHLKQGEEVICKICNKTAKEICNE